ncbi:THYLAKOID LUMENAL 15 KDA PROTEIN 1 CHLOROPLASTIC [Salix koriyanagi]|uniref:THYLAKOID LUMENAL 15 kDa PROTEIN 1 CHLOROPLASTIC n=1 Tax=Salix koriyanagi TaxID=2511006 RepID=A0A9Q0WTU5_9ROSI|nr:THYLAKOID LUMENAL 15 KDA PROTEIN 1 CHLOROPLASTIC [Salix koriyanagi]
MALLNVSLCTKTPSPTNQTFPLKPALPFPLPLSLSQPTAGIDTKQATDRRFCKDRGQDLTGKDFSGRTLIKQDFKTSILRQANFKGAKLLGASFFDADLTGADLSDADLRSADFSLANGYLISF